MGSGQADDDNGQDGQVSPRRVRPYTVSQSPRLLITLSGERWIKWFFLSSYLLIKGTATGWQLSCVGGVLIVAV